jgi:predicted RNase H-like HicB family nuclease
LSAVFEPAKEGGYTCFVEEIPAAISQGETLEEAKSNLTDALKLVLQCQRELAEKKSFPIDRSLSFVEEGFEAGVAGAAHWQARAVGENREAAVLAVGLDAHDAFQIHDV